MTAASSDSESEASTSDIKSALTERSPSSKTFPPSVNIVPMLSLELYISKSNVIGLPPLAISCHPFGTLWLPGLVDLLAVDLGTAETRGRWPAKCHRPNRLNGNKLNGGQQLSCYVCEASERFERSLDSPPVSSSRLLMPPAIRTKALNLDMPFQHSKGSGHAFGAHS